MAQFRTAQSQYILPIDVNVQGTVDTTNDTAANRKAAIHRNDLVVLTPASGSVPAYIKKATSKDAATHMVALTDQTIGGEGHIRTDLQNYASSELIAKTVTTGSSGTAATVKRVGLYPLFDKDDIILDADGNDLAAS